MAKCKFEKNNFNITFLNFYNLYKRNFDYSLFILIISYSPGRIYIWLFARANIYISLFARANICDPLWKNVP